MITIFSDGSSRGNPGPGGWGTVIVAKQRSKEGRIEREVRFITELGGGEKSTTNNRMELKAVAEGLRKVPKDAQATIYTDSSYVINGITKWIKGWKRNGWKTKTKEDVLNRDLWEEIADLMEDKEIEWRYVGGHIGVVGNERCDHIATAFADERGIKLYDGPLALYDLPNILNISADAGKKAAKKSDSSRSRVKAYSYISMVGGVIGVHKTWAECEKRVKGTKGARYKKSLDADDERSIIAEYAAL